MWTDDQLNYFVEVYKSHECLWKFLSSAVANHKSARIAAYEDISEKMRNFANPRVMTIEQVTASITSVRRRYYATKKKYLYTSKTPATPNWYKNMEEILNYRSPVVGHSVHKMNTDTASHDEVPASQSVDTLNPDEKIKENVPYEMAPSVIFEINKRKLSKYNSVIQKSKPKNSSVSLQTRIYILHILKQNYVTRVAPDYKIMFDTLKKFITSKDRFKDFSTDSHLVTSVDELQIELHSLGYLCKETKGGTKMIIEKPEQRFERYLYLNKLAKIRNKQIQRVVYIDERIVDLSQTYKKYDPNRKLPEHHSIYYHAVAREGLVNGLFCNQVKTEDFKKWVTDILLGLLDGPCVIVMDTNSLHGQLVNACSVTGYSTKYEMMKWLNNNSIPCSANTSKPELYDLIMKNQKTTKEYEIDRIICSHGHQVLRLPSSFKDLSMTELIWHAISESRLGKNVDKLDDLQSIIIDRILPSITPVKWKEFENLLITKETEIMKIDVAVENLLDSYEFVDTNDFIEIS